MEPPATPSSLYRLLSEIKPRRALFTSYTFSADWFESTAYPLLRKIGCEQVTVMLDARQARNSIDNTTSRFGGSRYRVISTTPTGQGAGIFHPKIAYLECAAEDVLVVGSGNLTSTGQGRWLEVLDCVSSREDPEIFGDVAYFFERLPSRLALLAAADKAVLRQFAVRAAYQQTAFLKATPQPRRSWLITTLDRTAGSQFASLASENLGSPDVLTVLSPYHNEDVSPVLSLMKALKAKKVSFALVKNNKDEYLAPFNPGSSTERRSYVTPSRLAAAGRPRPLHAKWFELHDEKADSTLVMTGSVNATQQSLWHSGNIEVALARLLKGKSQAGWRQCKGTVTFAPCAFPSPADLPEPVNCAASLAASGVLEVLFEPTPKQAHVELTLHHGTKNCGHFVSAISAAGRVTVKVNSRVLANLGDATLWLTVAGKGYKVTTWVNIESELQAKPHEVDLQKALKRADAGTAADEDIFLLLSWAHVHLTQRVLTDKGGAGKIVPENAGEAVEAAVVSRADWEQNLQAGRTKSAGGGTGVLRLFRLISQLLHDVESTDPEQDSGENPSDESRDNDRVAVNAEIVPDEPSLGSAGESEDPRARKKRMALRDAVERARQSVRDAIAQRLNRPVSDEDADWLMPLMAQLGVQDALPMSMRNVDLGLERPERPLDLVTTGPFNRVLFSFGAANISEIVRARFLPLVVAVGALAALVRTRRGIPAHHAELKNLIETFAKKRLDSQDYAHALSLARDGGQLPVLAQFACEDLAEQARSISQAVSLEDHIDRIITYALAEHDTNVPGNFSSGDKEIVSALRYAKSNHEKYSYYLVVTDDARGISHCPRCGGPFDNEKSRLIQEHRALCKGSCRRPVPVFIRPTRLAARAFFAEDQALRFGPDLRPMSDEECT